MSKKIFIALTDNYTSKKKAINIDDITFFEEKDDFVSITYLHNAVTKIINVKETFGYIKYNIAKSNPELNYKRKSEKKKDDNIIYDNMLRFTDIDNKFHSYCFDDITTKIRFGFDVGILYFGINGTQDFTPEEYQELVQDKALTFWEFVKLSRKDYLQFRLNSEEIKLVQRQYARHKLNLINNPIPEKKSVNENVNISLNHESSI